MDEKEMVRRGRARRVAKAEAVIAQDACADGCARGCSHDISTKPYPAARSWHAGRFAGGHQGSVIDEKTGKTIALTYDPADAPLVAAAPDLLAVCLKLRNEGLAGQTLNDWSALNTAIAKAEGR